MDAHVVRAKPTDRFEFKGLSGKKIEKVAKEHAERRHRADTEARVELLRDASGDPVIGPDGRPVEKILGPLTKPGVPVGRYFDVKGRRAEIQAGQHEAVNAMLDDAARIRAFRGEGSDFVVGGQHQWSQNIAHGGHGYTAGTTSRRGPGPGLVPGGTAPPPAGGVGGGRGALEFRERAQDFQAASDSAGVLGRIVLAPGVLGQRAMRANQAWQRQRDVDRGLVRPVIGYRPQGGDVNFSRQMQGQQAPPQQHPPPPGPVPFQPAGQPPGGTPPTPAGGPPQGPPPGPVPFQPPGGTRPSPPAGGPKGPRPTTTPFNVPPGNVPFLPPTGLHGITAGGGPSTPPPVSHNPFRPPGDEDTHGITAGAGPNRTPTNPFPTPPPPPSNKRPPPPPPSTDPFRT